MATRATRGIGKQTTLRHVWLASLGASAMGSARAIDTAGRLALAADTAAARAGVVARDTGFVLRGAALTLRERLSPVRDGIEAQLTSGVFSALSALELPSPLAPRTKPRARRGRRASSKR